MCIKILLEHVLVYKKNEDTFALFLNKADNKRNMDGMTGFLIIVTGIAALLVPGIVLINQGKNNKTKLIVGWCLVGTVATGVTFGLGFLIVVAGSSILGWLLALTPILIIIGLIVTITFGIDCLVKGFSKDKEDKRNENKITTGFILIGINLTIFLSILTLLILFASGLIPIVLM